MNQKYYTEQKMVKIKTNSGNSLPEVAITLVILTVLIIVMVSTFSFSQIALMKQGMRRAALHIAKSELERELGNSWSVIAVGNRPMKIKVGETFYDVSCDIGEYVYTFGTDMAKKAGSPATLPATISNIPFDSDWWIDLDKPTVLFKLVRITVTYGQHKDTLYLQQLVTENWRA